MQSVTNWLTPVWILSVGISIGFLLVLLMMAKIFLFSRLGWFQSVWEKPGLRMVLGSVLGLVYLAIAILVFGYVTDAPNVLKNFGRDSEQYSNLFNNFVLLMVLGVPFCLLLGFGAWSVVSKRGAADSMSLFREGFLYWINIVCVGALVFAALGYVLGMFNGFGVINFAEDPKGLLTSLGRIPFAGTYEVSATIPPGANDATGDELAVDFWGQECKWIEIRSDQKLEVSIEPITTRLTPDRIFRVPATSVTQPLVYFPRIERERLIPPQKIDRLYVLNLGRSDAHVTVKYRVGPMYSEVWLIPFSAISVLLLYFAYLSAATMFPKVSAIALSTFKTEISQPLFLIVFLIGVIFMVASIYVPYNTFGEDIKMYKDSGLTLIRVLAIFLAIWGASKSVAEEIEGRTALTVLSKPVGRRQFIFGKFGGISMAVALLFIALGLWFMIWTAYKPVYDGVESSKGIGSWQECFQAATSVIPALFLQFLEVVIFVAISIAISTRMGILANFLICFSIYVLGHLTPLIVQSAEAAQAFETVGFFGQLIAIVFPVLNHFDVQAAINTERPVPLDYVAWSVIYTALYGAMAMLLALVMFEDRDLA